MNYSATELDELTAAANNANSHTPFNVHSGAFVLAAQALLPHVFRAIAALDTQVPRYSADDLKTHIGALRRLGHTLASIASDAGVSIATISRIVNDVRSTTNPTTATAIMGLDLVAPPSPVDPQIVAELLAGDDPRLRRNDKPHYIAHMAGLDGMTDVELARIMRISRVHAISALRKAAA